MSNYEALPLDVRESAMSDSQKKILNALFTYSTLGSTSENGSFYISNERLRKEAEVGSNKTIQSVLSFLITNNFITRQSGKQCPNGGVASTYVLNTENIINWAKENRKMEKMEAKKMGTPTKKMGTLEDEKMGTPTGKKISTPSRTPNKVSEDPSRTPNKVSEDPSRTPNKVSESLIEEVRTLARCTDLLGKEMLEELRSINQGINELCRLFGRQSEMGTLLEKMGTLLRCTDVRCTTDIDIDKESSMKGVSIPVAGNVGVANACNAKPEVEGENTGLAGYGFEVDAVAPITSFPEVDDKPEAGTQVATVEARTVNTNAQVGIADAVAPITSKPVIENKPEASTVLATGDDGETRNTNPKKREWKQCKCNPDTYGLEGDATFDGFVEAVDAANRYDTNPVAEDNTNAQVGIADAVPPITTKVEDDKPVDGEGAQVGIADAVAPITLHTPNTVTNNGGGTGLATGNVGEGNDTDHASQKQPLNLLPYRTPQPPAAPAAEDEDELPSLEGLLAQQAAEDAAIAADAMNNHVVIDIAKRKEDNETYSRLYKGAYNLIAEYRKYWDDTTKGRIESRLRMIDDMAQRGEITKKQIDCAHNTVFKYAKEAFDKHLGYVRAKYGSEASQNKPFSDTFGGQPEQCTTEEQKVAQEALKHTRIEYMKSECTKPNKRFDSNTMTCIVNTLKDYFPSDERAEWVERWFDGLTHTIPEYLGIMKGKALKQVAE